MNSKLRVALIVLPCVLAVHCTGQGGLEINSAERSYWYETSLFATFLYLLVGPLVALRAADARVVAALPMIGNTVVTSFAVFNLMRILDQVGYVSTGGNAVAAGLAEAIFPCNWLAGDPIFGNNILT